MKKGHIRRQFGEWARDLSAKEIKAGKAKVVLPLGVAQHKPRLAEWISQSGLQLKKAKVVHCWHKTGLLQAFDPAFQERARAASLAEIDYSGWVGEEEIEAGLLVYELEDDEDPEGLPAAAAVGGRKRNRSAVEAEGGAAKGREVKRGRKSTKSKVKKVTAKGTKAGKKKDRYVERVREAELPSVCATRSE